MSFLAKFCHLNFHLHFIILGYTCWSNIPARLISHEHLKSASKHRQNDRTSRTASLNPSVRGSFTIRSCSAFLILPYIFIILDKEMHFPKLDPYFILERIKTSTLIPIRLTYKCIEQLIQHSSVFIYIILNLRRRL